MKTEWNLNLLGNPKDFPKQRKIWINKTEKFINKWKNNKEYLKDPKVLKQALDEYEAWQTKFGNAPNELYYYWLKSEKNKNNTEIKAKLNQIQEISIELSNKMQFFFLDLAKTKNKDIFLKEESLKPYKHFLKTLFDNAKYLLSDKEEKILNLNSQTSHTFWVDMLERFLSKEERIINKKNKSYEEIITLM